MIDYSDEDITLVLGNPLSEVTTYTGIVGGVYGVAQISYAASSTLLSDKSKYPYFSRLTASTEFQSLAIRDSIDYYSQFGLGWKKVGVIATSEEYGISVAKTFIDNAHDKDIEIATFEQFLLEQEDLSVEMGEFQKSGARVFFAAVLRQWEELIVAADSFGLVGENYVWFGPHVIVDDPFDGDVARLSNGVIGTFQYFPEEDQDYIDFVARWETLDPEIYFGAGPGTIPTPFSIIAYDIVITSALVLEEIINEGEYDPLEERIPAELWSDKIRNTTFDGLSGKVLFDPKGDRLVDFRLEYYNAETNSWKTTAIRTLEEYQFVDDVIWYSNTTDIPDLDIRPPFDYWSCHDGKEKHDPTGKTITIHTPDGDNIDDIDIDYHCDHFIDCKNFSDERIDCSTNYLILFIVFGIITGLLILIAFLFLVFVFIFGVCLKYRRLTVASPTFLVILLISQIIGLSSVFAWFGKPHTVACIFRPWLLGVPALSIICAISVKIYRIWRIFKHRMRKKLISDFSLFILYVFLLLPVFVIIVIWCIVSTPSASMVERDGNDHYLCTSGGFTGTPGGLVFFFILVAYGICILFFGIFLTVATRNVPSQFNEGKLLAISVYNLGFLSVVIIPVFLVLEEYQPFIAWILRTCAILYGFSATMFLQFIPPVFGIIFIDRFKNIKKFSSSLNNSSALNHATSTTSTTNPSV